MKFGKAIKALKEGKAIARKGWGGKGVFMWRAPSSGEPRFSLKITFDNVPNWTPSVEDCLTEDWEIIDLAKEPPADEAPLEVPAETEVYKNPHLDYLRTIIPLMEKTARAAEKNMTMSMSTIIRESRILRLGAGRQTGMTVACKRYLTEFTPRQGQEVGSGVYVDFRTNLVYQPTLHKGEFGLATWGSIRQIDSLVKDLSYKEDIKTIFVSGPAALVENFLAKITDLCQANRSMFHPDLIIVIDR